MAVAVAMDIGFPTIVVDGQLQLGPALLFQQVNEGEAFKREPRGFLEAERLLINALDRFSSRTLIIVWMYLAIAILLVA
jgi:hypothetical protein